MASKLHSQYGFSYDNLKVLLGGWNTWKQENAKDPNAYPEEITAGTTPASGGTQPTVVTGGGIVQVTPAAATPAP